MNGVMASVNTMLALSLLAMRDGRAEAIAREWTYHANPPPGMTRAELNFKDVSTNSIFTGVLVLSPGMNGNGSQLLADNNWTEFARRHNFLMVGLSFASSLEDLKNGKGYYYADKGSGRVLLNGLSDAKVVRLPMFMYGFSGGAHFTSRFVLWNPEKIGAWCACSAAWWKLPLHVKGLPPGIVACGERDFRIDPSREFFECGRNVGAEWLWIGLHNVVHSSPAVLENFFRRYVTSILRTGKASCSVWINIYTGQEENDEFVKRFPCAVGWLPDRILLDAWLKLRGL